MKKATIVTYGCQMNINESEKLKTVLSELGYAFTNTLDETDLVILNTCTIREGAANKVYGKLGELKTLKRTKKDMIVIVSGCLAQEEGQNLLKKFKHINIVLGNQNLYLLKESIAKIEAEEKKQILLTNGIDLLPPLIYPHTETETTAYVSITYGCNNFCAYCIVPYVRGRERSETLENVISQMQVLANKGIQEIILLGQNVNSYGKGSEDLNFAKLLREIKKQVPGKFRLRFTSPHPRDFTLETIKAIADDTRICRNIHLPLQAGSDYVLKLMNRGYTKESYLALVELMKEHIPDVTFTTDIIVGFPGETEEDFQETLDVVSRVGFENAFMFMYSVRKGTKAETMEGHLEESVKKERHQQLTAVQTEMSLKQSEKLLHTVQEVLVEGFSNKNTDFMQGRTESYKVVLIPTSDTVKIGSFVKVKITKALTWTLYGDVVEEGC